MLALIDESPYLCFHANEGYVQRNVEQIATAVEQIHEAHGLPVVLLPIGRYVGLDDHIGLAELQQRLRTPSRMVSAEASLWEIMLTIAQSRIFLGTSLHGAVTSQSFAVPHLGLSGHSPNKLDHYLGTWDLAEQSQCVAIGDPVDHIGRALAVPQAARNEKRAELIQLARRNFVRLLDVCLGGV
jgi:polysaccharide pyruvyl transferase WcaK-like protein